MVIEHCQYSYLRACKAPKRYTLYAKRSTQSLFCILSSYYTVFPIRSIMQNKPNFGNDKMNINTFLTMRYVNLDTGSDAKTNPIQTQTKPILGQYQGCQSQNKPKTNPICSPFSDFFLDNRSQEAKIQSA